MSYNSPFLHSCGYTIEIIGDWREAGLQVIQLDQQENMGMENLAKEHGGEICFFCPVDIQATMINGTIQDVRNYARRLIDVLGNYNGGFIAKWYGSPEAAGHDMEKVDAMSEEFVKYGAEVYG